MFTELYNFFFDWLFGGVYPTFMSQQSAELATIAMAVIVTVAVIGLAITPIKAIARWICGG